MDSNYKVKYFPPNLHKRLIFFYAIILTFKERHRLPNLALRSKIGPVLQGLNIIITINFQRRP